MSFTLTALYVIALCNCGAKRFYFMAYYASRAVIFICLCIIIHHAGQMCLKVNYSLSKLEFYDAAKANSCFDAYSVLDYDTVKANLLKARSHCISSLVFSVLMLVYTMMDMCLGTMCLVEFELKVHRLKSNVIDMFKSEAWQFLIVGYYKFNSAPDWQVRAATVGSRGQHSWRSCARGVHS